MPGNNAEPEPQTQWQASIASMMRDGIDRAVLPGYMNALDMPLPCAWQEGSATLRWQANETMHQGSDAVFGGYLAALADYAAGVATLTVLSDDEFFSTAELSTSFIKPVNLELIDIVATVTGRNRKTVHVNVAFWNAADKEDPHKKAYATAKALQIISRKR